MNNCSKKGQYFTLCKNDALRGAESDGNDSGFFPPGPRAAAKEKHLLTGCSGGVARLFLEFTKIGEQLERCGIC